MKTFKFLAGAAALLAVGFASCSDDKVLDEPVNDGPQKVEYDQTQYVCVEISSPREGAKGRAFEDGTTNESYVNSISFLFYDAAGKPTAAPMTFEGDDLKDADFSEGGFEDGNVTRIWTSVVPVQLVQGANLPSQVICIVNARPGRVTELASKDLVDIRDEQIDLFNDGPYFIMTNSVYFGQNVLTGQSNQRLCATPINGGQLFPSREEAENAISGADGGAAALVNIYVERLAAKVGLTMGAGASKDYVLKNSDGSDVTLKFVPEFWFMNAIANQNYITKRYGVPTTGTGINLFPTYADIDKNFEDTGMAGSWNAPAQHRSYWACSPSYNNNMFPNVSDEVNDLEGHSTDYPQTYYSYNGVKEIVNREIQITNQAIPAEGGAFSITNTGNAATGYIYTKETTTAITRIRDTNGNPAATVGSAVVLGHYEVNGVVSTFYIDRNAGSNGTYYADATAAKAVLAARQRIVFMDNEGTATAKAETFKLAHPSKATRDLLANPNLAGRLVTVQIADDVDLTATPLFYWNGSAYTRVDAANLAQVNADLVTAGYMDMFANGTAFFSIPIRHLGFDPAICMEDGKYQWSKMRVGDLGIVRNHVYSITVNSISGLGTGVRSLDQPIVPPITQMDQYVAARLNILAWNVVPAWGVDL